MITSPHNEKLKLVRRLTTSRRDREREGLFLTEGEDLAEAGLAAGAEPVFLLRPAGEPGSAATEAGAIEVEPQLLAELSTLGSGTRLMGVWPEVWASPADRLSPIGEDFCIYLDGIADPGNVGTIIRSADALLSGTVVPGPDCADPYGPKAVRASMGSVFSRPPARIGLDELPGPLLGLVARGGEWPLEQVLSRLEPGPAGKERGRDGLKALTIALGAEREGLSPEVTDACDALITIPLRGGAESLNVAAAAAICLERVSSLAVLATGSDLEVANEETDA